jgi:malate dehydrogenase (oxaloacetate-decarboxylating)(NADP+)
MNQIAKTKQAENLLGLALVNDPARNKGTAFTEDERRQLRLEGLLPPSTENFERQVERVSGHLEATPTDLAWSTPSRW